jgi:hypothetical protein
LIPRRFVFVVVLFSISFAMRAAVPEPAFNVAMPTVARNQPVVQE